MKNRTVATLVTVGLIFGFLGNSKAVTTMGDPSCGRWMQYRQPNGSPHMTMQASLVGFLSGMAVAEKVDVLKTVDNESLYLWIDNFCKANPLMYVFDGGLQLFIELKRRKGL